MSHKNAIKLKKIIKQGETLIFIYCKIRFGIIRFGSVRIPKLRYLVFRYFTHFGRPLKILQMLKNCHKNKTKRGKLNVQGEPLFSYTMRFSSVWLQYRSFGIRYIRYLPTSVVHCKYIYGGMSFYTWQQTIEMMAGRAGEKNFY